MAFFLFSKKKFFIFCLGVVHFPILIQCRMITVRLTVFIYSSLFLVAISVIKKKICLNLPLSSRHLMTGMWESTFHWNFSLQHSDIVTLELRHSLVFSWYFYRSGVSEFAMSVMILISRVLISRILISILLISRILISMLLISMLLISRYRIHNFFSLKIINPKKIHKNILEILDQNRINIKITFLYFSTNQLKT